MSGPLPIKAPAEIVRERRSPVSTKILNQAAEIVETVRAEGESALRRYSEGFGDITERQTIVLGRADLLEAVDGLDGQTRDLLERVANRVRRFATAQLGSMTSLDVAVEGGRAGHSLHPVGRVGAYAPGGRHPLPSSVLMTVIPARVAGVEEVWVASPRPTQVTIAAAGIAGADGLLAVGGAQAIAALAFGTVSPACEMVVGPGNAWVTAAKKHLYGEIGIDGLAGPSEIVVIADHDADPALVAADLLAQAEHDPMAQPILITTSEALLDEVQLELSMQLEDLPTAAVARSALSQGFAVSVDSFEDAVSISEHLAPEHLALHVTDPDELSKDLTAYGSLFIGDASAEALADYGVGPNHVLPTGGGARFQPGLSVFTFLRTPTWLRIDDAHATASDAANLARLEGLEAHARAALRRGDRPKTVL
jgi:phosphoribosyl-ATP pyrophosphohydrolase/phosphoribosyl-AMP cyclohydrolase/histidinol dehydrogenase